MPTKPVNTKGNFFEATLFLKQRIQYDANGNAIYLGYAAPGSSENSLVWMIVKNTYDASNYMTASNFAGGEPTFERSWSLRTSYVYS